MDDNINLVLECVDYQFRKCKEKTIKEFRDDFLQDLIVTLYDYDNEKLNDAYNGNHLNALVTRIIQNNIYSKTSPFYTVYRKFIERADEITPKIRDEYAG